ncbi:MAG: hypothetical protein H7835_10270 [Magnetococcus sp. XQGC-1]
MGQAVTFDDVWKMFQETDRKFQETARRFQETDRKFQETDRKFQETDRKFQETDRKFQETDRKFQETDRKFRETDRKLGQLGGRLGEFVEGLVAPACKTLFAQRGIPVHKVSRRVEADLPGDRRIEIDLFVVNTDAVVLVEVKSKLTVEDVREHLGRMAEFKEFFPEYAGKQAIGAVAGMVVEENVRRFAIHQGLFVLEQAGEMVRMANDAAFVPRLW